MFTALHALAKQATLMITIAAEGDDQLRVNVTPIPFDDKTKAQLPEPLSLLATPSEFDADFIAALATWQAPKRSTEERFEAAGKAVREAVAAGAANTRYFNPESLKAAGQRFLLGPDGVGAAWVHPLELANPRYGGWTDCTDMSDELFQRLIAERQHNTRLAAIALPGA